MVVSIKDAFEVLKFLDDKVTYWRKSKQTKIDKIFKNVVETSFHQLETIHRDYATQLSELRNYLVDQSLPPPKLIKWLREAGLKYRHDREFLGTIEDDILDFGGHRVSPTKKGKDRFIWSLQQYVKAVMKYYRCTISHNNRSYYRDYEHQLDIILLMIKKEYSEKIGEKKLASLFYDYSHVQDMHRILIELCDKRLPSRWQDVCRAYRWVRAAAGYPDTDQEDDK